MSSIEPFSFHTIKEFDDHIAKSIPNYEELISAICNVAPFYLSENSSFYDLGCSTGTLLEKIQFTGLKIGIDRATNLWQKKKDLGIAFYDDDIIEFLKNGELFNASLVTSIFTLQFLPKKDRFDALKAIYKGLNEGGAFICAEKVSAESGHEQEVMTFAYYDFKQKTFAPDEILNKERDLRVIMKPNLSSENIYLAQKAGFKRGFLMYKFFNFECWVWIKSAGDSHA